MKYFIPLIAILALSAPVNAERSFDPDVSHWIEIKRPKDIGSPDGAVFRYAANYSDLEWNVKEEKGKIKASLHKDTTLERPAFTPRTTRFKKGYRFKKVDDGWLVSFNQGEFGSELWWFSENGESSYKISNDQANQFISLNKNVYAIQGLSHMGSSRGSLTKIDKRDGRWISIIQVGFGESPEAISRMEDNSLAIVLTNSLVRVDEDFNVTKVVGNSNWGTFYPNSIASNNSQLVYIGMRQYVVEVNLQTGAVRYLIPSMEFLNKLKSYQEKRIREMYRSFQK